MNNDSWSDFVENIDERWAIPLKILWNDLTAIEPTVQLPVVYVKNDNMILQWSSQRYLLEIEISKEIGTFEWFFRDRISNTIDGTKFEPEKELPIEIIASYVKKFN